MEATAWMRGYLVDGYPSKRMRQAFWGSFGVGRRRTQKHIQYNYTSTDNLVNYTTLPQRYTSGAGAGGTVGLLPGAGPTGPVGWIALLEGTRGEPG